LLAGLSMILAAASVESSYSEGLLLNLGVGVLLFAALYIVQRHVLDRVRQVREETEKSVERISENVEQVRQDLAEARIRLEEVGPLAQAALARERERDKARLRSLDESVDFDTVRDLLNRAKNSAPSRIAGCAYRPYRERSGRAGILDMTPALWRAGPLARCLKGTQTSDHRLSQRVRKIGPKWGDPRCSATLLAPRTSSR
jgi:hypothetical protein